MTEFWCSDCNEQAWSFASLVSCPRCGEYMASQCDEECDADEGECAEVGE